MKSRIWSFYFYLRTLLPRARGITRMGSLLEKAIGRPLITVLGVRVELSPNATDDEYVQNVLGKGSVIDQTIRDYLAPDDLFVDVGANIGLYTAYAALRGASVISIEPSARECARLRRTLELNGVLHRLMKLHEVAAGEMAGVSQLVLDPDGSHLKNRLAWSSEAIYNTARIPVARIDELISPSLAKRVRVMKIDVEGYEMDVIQGLAALWPWLGRTVFVVEITPAWLEKRGFDLGAIYGAFESKGWTPTIGPKDAFQWDEVFLPPQADAPSQSASPL